MATRALDRGTGTALGTGTATASAAAAVAGAVAESSCSSQPSKRDVVDDDAVLLSEAAVLAASDAVSVDTVTADRLAALDASSAAALAIAASRCTLARAEYTSSSAARFSSALRDSNSSRSAFSRAMWRRKARSDASALRCLRAASSSASSASRLATDAARRALRSAFERPSTSRVAHSPPATFGSVINSVPSLNDARESWSRISPARSRDSKYGAKFTLMNTPDAARRWWNRRRKGI